MKSTTGYRLAAAIESDVDTVFTQDLQDGLVVDGALTVRNPFAELGGT